MAKVTFPQTELETRTAVHQIRLDHGFKTADEALIYLIGLEAKNKFLEQRCAKKEHDVMDLINEIAARKDEYENEVDKLVTELNDKDKRIAELENMLSNI